LKLLYYFTESLNLSPGERQSLGESEFFRTDLQRGDQAELLKEDW